jgi:hypothetical protein
MAVREELFNLITPSDLLLMALDSERAVLGAALSGRLAHSEVDPLHGKHFAVGLYGALWDASRASLTPLALLEAVKQEYPWAAQTIIEVTPVACEPSPAYSDLVESAARIRELWTRRVLATELSTCARMLAAETITVPDTLDRLRKIVAATRAP